MYYDTTMSGNATYLQTLIRKLMSTIKMGLKLDIKKLKLLTSIATNLRIVYGDTEVTITGEGIQEVCHKLATGRVAMKICSLLK